MLLTRYRQQVSEDKAKLAQLNGPRPLSRAYQSLDLMANNALVEEEEKLNL